MKWLGKLFKYGLILGLTGAIIGALAVGAAYYYLQPDLPDISNLRHVQFQVPLKVYSEDNKLIAEFGEKRRTPLSYQQVPKLQRLAFLSAEDANFHTHPGVDFRGLARAGIQLLLTGKKKQGGSTITMQVARNFYLSRKKTYTRKLSEIFLSFRIEQELSKAEILELYLNKIYMGHRAYGVGAAAQVYYGKPITELSLAQMAMIAGLPKAPSRFNPITNPPRALQRRNYVLGRMLELGHIDHAAHDAARAEPISARRYIANIEVEAPYIAEMVRKEMVGRFGQEAYTGGFKAYTTTNAKYQTAANKGIRKALDDYSRRHGYRGPEGHVEQVPGDEKGRDAILADISVVGELLPGLVLQIEEKTASVHISGGRTIMLDWDGLKWARRYKNTNIKGGKLKTAADVLSPGDLIRVQEISNKDGETNWRLAQIPRVSGALISIDPSDGAIKALVGGYDFYQSKFNRVTQARRQPGSGFKPVIYSAALEKGFTAASLINDAPVVFNDPSLEGAWRPENYSGKFFGPTRLRYALTKSRNLVSIRLLRSIGIPYAVNYAKKFGFETGDLPQNLSLALGSANVMPIQMARAYAVLANGGYLVEPYLIKRIERNEGTPVYEHTPLKVCPECKPADKPPVTPATEATEVTPGKEDALVAAIAPRVISKQNRYIMYSMMQDVVQRGTAVRAKVLKRRDLAGKTGTTNDQRDAWFNGFNQGIVTNVWVGFDSNDKLGRGEVGGRAALPAWIDYMRVALQDIPDRSPRLPKGMVTARIDPESGLQAPAGTKGAIFEVFRENRVPKKMPERQISLPGAAGTEQPGAPSGSTAPAEELF